ncbi:TetR/AcrR family transcriptional regulator [Gordonia sp. NB41Y]|uniref:TetR/AcrR family transcriptional regulator n=1 Tax=Gordonia sp. NB41Y TaxID=875808 RepID=UPI0002BDA273|nr:TetR/AcrR family transcriptional regulator [Gordonia sp. NB41Y]EMP15201.1 hypothetical protein ISGA_193 [Gordonia sp. NB41Y]WLP89937.1 TetR/AcrR family transcriptional regulator [Gordonia sp. NB41Y]
MTQAAGAATSRKGTRVDRRRARTREQILDVAEGLFVDGFSSVKVEQLADGADVSVGAIYTHFGSKEGVLLGLAERAFDEFGAELDEAFDPQLSAIEQVMAVADRYVRFYLRHREVFRVVVLGTEVVEGSDARSHVTGLIQSVLDRFEAAIQAAIQADEMDGAYDAASTARFLWGAWNGVITLGLRRDDLALTDAELLDCLETGRRLVNEGLASPNHRTSEGRSQAHLTPPVR